MTAPWIMRPKTRAVSLTGSPRSELDFARAQKHDLAPSSRMPTSNETRVRVDDFENISAQICPDSGIRSRRAARRLNTRSRAGFSPCPRPAIFPMTIIFHLIKSMVMPESSRPNQKYQYNNDKLKTHPAIPNGITNRLGNNHTNQGANRYCCYHKKINVG